MSQRFRYWVFTWNNYPDNYATIISEQFNNGTFKYVCYQREVGGETGTPHVQGYVECTKQYRLSTCQQWFRAYWEPRKGTADQAIAYCSKTATRIEGTSPITLGEPSGQGKRTDILEAKRLLDEGGSLTDVAEEHFGVFLKFQKGLMAYQLLHAPTRNWKTHVNLYWGDAGTGKSRRAHWEADQEAGGKYVKPVGEWWDGYTGQANVIIDDFYGTMPYSMLLNVLDRYECKVPVKGGFVQFAAKNIWITSNKAFEEWYASDKHKPEAIRRRIDCVVHFSSQFGVWEPPVVEWPTNSVSSQLPLDNDGNLDLSFMHDLPRFD